MPRWEQEVEWANQTSVHPLAAAAVLGLATAMIAVPRRWAIAPMMVIACFIPSTQRVVIAGFDLDLLRFMILAGWLRMLIRGEFAGFQWKPIDTVFVLFLLANTAVMTIQHGTADVLVNRLGWVYNGAGMYFLFRCFIRTWDDVEAPFTMLAVLSMFVALFFIVEHKTARNLFSMFGGVPEITVERQGRLRCQGAFRHPILAGCFWASLVPFFVVMVMSRKGATKLLGMISVVAALVCVYLSASSTPIIAAAVGVMGLAAFAIRNWLAMLRWTIVIVALALHVAMSKPVWHLLARIRIVSASTAWHRFWVLDQAINNFSEWYLLGTRSTLHWGGGPRLLYDITNQYVVYAIQGGLITVLLFFAMLYYAFRAIGQMTRAMEGYRYHQLMTWAIGSGLLVHCAAFFATSYFGQIVALWHLHLAIAGSLALPLEKAARSGRTPGGA